MAEGEWRSGEGEWSIIPTYEFHWEDAAPVWESTLRVFETMAPTVMNAARALAAFANSTPMQDLVRLATKPEMSELNSDIIQ